MAYNSWTPLWRMIVSSSLWDEPDWIVKIFVTMLAMKDADHIYRGTAYQLSRESRKSEQEVLDAWKVLSAPDTKRVEPQEFEGRRIKSVPEGWLILNGEKYRELVSIEMKRTRNRKAQAAWRERKRLGKSAPLAGERQYVGTLEREGKDAADAQQDRTQNGHATPAAETFTQKAEREVRERLAMKAQQNRGGDQ